jgi:hypothetical protein
MSLLSRFSPTRAVRDLWRFLSTRKRYEFYLMIPALLITGMLVAVFSRDSNVQPEREPTIIYVQSWPADRSDAEIIAQQKVDKIKKDREQADLAAKQKERQQQFKKMDDWLTKHGI